MARSKNVPYGQGRDELITAAITLIGERGVHALTMRQVAAQAQLVVGALSHHFASRTALIDAAFGEYVRQTEEVVGTTLTNTAAAETTTAARACVTAAIRAIYANPHAVMIRTELRTYAARNSGAQPLYRRLSRALNKLGEMFTATRGDSTVTPHPQPLGTELDAAALDLNATGNAELVADMVERYLHPEPTT